MVEQGTHNPLVSGSSPDGRTVYILFDGYGQNNKIYIRQNSYIMTRKDLYMSFIYAITNDVNGKQYVGKTNHQTIEERFKEHIKDSKKEHCEKRPLYDAMRKYGIEHFHIKELEECSCEEASNKEIYWIGRLDTYNNGYNATLGGDSKKYYDYKK